MLKTRMNKALIKHEKERKVKLINRVKFEVKLEDDIKQGRKNLWKLLIPK